MENYTVNNTLTILSSSAETADAIRAALDEAYSDLLSPHSGVYQFTTQWEPPLKEFADWAKRFPEARMELIGEAFSTQHWICIASAGDGKTRAETLTRIDGERFEEAFQKIFGRPFCEVN